MPGTIADLKRRASSPFTSDRTFHVTGVITFADQLSDFVVIQDPTGGLRISLPAGHSVTPYAMSLDVTGTFSNERSVRSFVASGFSLTKAQALPAAVPFNPTSPRMEEQLDKRVSVEGVVESIAAVQPGLEELTLRSGTTRIVVRAVIDGASDVEAWANATVRVTGVVLRHSGFDKNTYEIWTPNIQDVKLLHRSAAPVTPRGPTLRTALQVRELTPSEAALGFPVELNAVVTFFDSRPNLLFVQDKTDSIFVSLKPGFSPSLQAGDSVQIAGVTGAGDVAPVILRGQVTLHGKAKLPVPEPDIESAFMGQRDSRWVKFRGVVQDAVQLQNDVYANLVWGKHHYKAQILAPLDQVEAMIDREVAVEGVCGPLFNNSRQVLGVQLFVPGIRFIIPKEPAVSDPFRLPLRHAEALLQYSRDYDIEHRARLQGIVTLASRSGPTWIRDRNEGLMIQTHNASDIREGDVVDVVGFPAAGKYGPVVESALIRKVRSDYPPRPILTTASEALKGSVDSQLIRLDGTLLDSSFSDGVRVFRLAAGSDEFSAILPGPSKLSAFLPGTELRLTGICSVIIDDTRRALLARGFRLKLRSSDDLLVLRKAPWFTAERLGLTLAALFVLTLASLVWIALLRRNVARKTQSLDLKTSELQAAHELTRHALDQAREAESLEQSRRFLLELIANDEPLERIINEIARAAEKHSRNAICSLHLELSDGSRIESSSFQSAAISDTACSGNHKNGCVHVRVPIFADGGVKGALVVNPRDASGFSDNDRDLFPSWSQFASLALERRGFYDTLSFRAQYDALTGLHNRASFYERLGQELALAKCNRTMLAVLYMDLDGFKAINDTYGHDAGDFVLREVSERIAQSVRRSDVVGRLGGDEFVVILGQLAASREAERAAGVLRLNLSKPIQFESRSFCCGGSIGIALYPRDGDQADVLLRHADHLMYAEKAAHKAAEKADLPFMRQ